MGYKGYIAKEKKHNTYNIFNPNESVKIIEYQLPLGFKFKTFDEYKNFIKFYKEEYDKNKIYKWDAYKIWLNK